MMIKENEVVIRRKVFNAVCSSCGNDGPDAQTESDAIALAEDDGWLHKTKNVEGEEIHYFRCDECFEKLLDEQDKTIDDSLLAPEEE